ncbi:MAG: hypothetical protein CMJ64_27970 [Planctomycetaceae bacterium]|nr:hypothetical protein [Planctomycetaceae bacterium]
MLCEDDPTDCDQRHREEPIDRRVRQQRALQFSVGEQLLSTFLLGRHVCFPRWTNKCFRSYPECATASQGARKGKTVPSADQPLEPYKGTALFRRLNEHAKSLSVAENIEVSDFLCRSLVVDDIWIPLGESLLIETSAPVWNRILDGFGNHDPGRGRYNQERSPWDVVHPGREWALRCKENRKSYKKLCSEIGEFIASHT